MSSERLCPWPVLKPKMSVELRSIGFVTPFTSTPLGYVTCQIVKNAPRVYWLDIEGASRWIIPDASCVCIGSKQVPPEA